MNITERFIKFGTYFFFTAIILLIIATFGMPDFLGVSQSAKKGIVAEVNGETVTKRDVNRSLETIKQQFSQFGGGATGLEGFLESQAVEQSINRKLMASLAYETGFKPTQASAAIVLAQIYPQIYPDFVEKDGRFDFVKLEKLLQRSGQSRTQLEKLILEDIMNSQFQRIIQSVSPNNNIHDSVDQQMKGYTLKAQILSLSLEDFNKAIKKTGSFSEAEINAVFETDHKKNDPEAKLTETIKATIEEGLYQKKKPELVKNLLASSEYSPQKLRRILKAKANTMTSKDLFSEKSPENFKELEGLKKLKQFTDQLGTLELNKVGSPIEQAGKIYFVSVSERNLNLQEDFPEQSDQKQTLALAQMNSALNTLFRVSREQAVIIRFDKKNF